MDGIQNTEMRKPDSLSLSMPCPNVDNQDGVQFSGLHVQLNGRPILDDVSGCGMRGKVLAIMGPSGSGKTTLLNTIAGRQQIQSGEITLDGKTVDKSVRRGVSYVLQQDILFGNLTLRETIYFAAMMKLPDSMPKIDKMARIDEVVDALNIRDCLDTIIGTYLLRGLSGGEKKRANIACEIINSPDVLLLDEPTSGLDSYTAYMLMKQLKAYASSMNKVIITTIHQPATQIFNSFNNLLLLAKGKTVYYGAAKDVLKFFESIGRKCDSQYNPADFILEQVNSSREELQSIFDAIANKTGLNSNDRSTADELGHDNSVFVLENELEAKKASYYDIAILQPSFKKIDPERSDSRQELCTQSSRDDTQKWPTSFWTQFKLLSWRQFKVSRHEILSATEIIKPCVLAIILSCIYFQAERTDSTVADIQGLLFWNGSFWIIRALISSLTSFSGEMSAINKERASGMYRLSAYILAKMTSELPLVVLLPLVCHPITYWMTGQNPDAVSFILSWLVATMSSVAGQSIGLLIGAIFKRFDVAISVGAIYFLSSFLFMGFLTRHFPAWLSWGVYTSVFYYVYRALLVLEYASNDPLRCVGGSASIFAECSDQINNGTVFVPSNSVLELEGVRAPVYCYILSLLSIITVCRIFIYVAFRLFRKPK